MQVANERLALARSLQGREELQLAPLKGLLEQFHEAREHLHGQKEPVAARDSALVVRRQSSAGHHAMQLRIVHQGLAPGM